MISPGPLPAVMAQGVLSTDHLEGGVLKNYTLVVNEGLIILCTGRALLPDKPRSFGDRKSVV